MLVQIPAVAVVARRIRLAQRKLMNLGHVVGYFLPSWFQEDVSMERINASKVSVPRTIKDERIKLTNEAFGSIRLLKMCPRWIGS